MSRRGETDQNLKKKIVKTIKRMVVVLCLLFFLVSFLNWRTEDEGVWKPDYPKVNLENIVAKGELTAEDYHTIFLQTGLGRPAVEALMMKNAPEDRGEVFEKYQNDFFAGGEYESRVAALIVHDERVWDENGEPLPGFEISDLRDGDILITKSTYSLGWRHGHAAIVIDAQTGETLEAVLLGDISRVQSVDKWRSYPSFIQLRLRDGDVGIPGKAAELARTEVIGVPYGLLTGIPVKAPKDIKKTQCAHLVWYPYERLGYDLDSDGFWLVTPKDIANSEQLEVVQVYGVNPDEIWP